MINQKESRNFLPSFITGAFVVIPLAFMLGILVGNKSPLSLAASADSFSSWVSALSTVAIGLLTFVLAKETWYLRLAQISQLDELRRENVRPNVGIQLENSAIQMSLINVKINNFGKGIARRISFEFFDRHGNLVHVDKDPVVQKFHKLALFRVGIESMGIGQEISSYVFSFFELGNELGGKIFEPYLNIVVKFQDVEGRQYDNSFAVDFAQYEGISGIGGDAMHTMANGVKGIQEALAKIAGGNGPRLDVNVFDTSDRSIEVAQTREWIEEQRHGRKVPKPYRLKRAKRRNDFVLSLLQSMAMKNVR